MTAPSPPEGAPGAKRPVSIFLTVACAFAGLADLQAVTYAFSPPVRAQFSHHPWAPGVVAALALLQIVCLIALWRGRRAGLFAYLALAGAHSGIMVVTGGWAVRFLLWPVLVALAGAWAWDRLR